MSIIHLCERCGESAQEWHHKFHRHKNRVRTYGKPLIDDPRNGAYLCHRCHQKHKGEFHYSEREFIVALGLLGYCKKKSICLIENYPFCEVGEIMEECYSCRKYEFDKENYYLQKKQGQY